MENAYGPCVPRPVWLISSLSLRQFPDLYSVHNSGIRDEANAARRSLGRLRGLQIPARHVRGGDHGVPKNVSFSDEGAWSYSYLIKLTNC